VLCFEVSWLVSHSKTRIVHSSYDEEGSTVPLNLHF
jgi:hypothetical protein